MIKIIVCGKAESKGAKRKMIAKIICPSCQTMGQFSVDGGNFKGPYRCWKCRTLYTLDMVNSAVVSLQPLTEEEFKEIKAKQEAEKHGHTSGGGVAHTTPQAPPEHAEPVIWPKVENRNTGGIASHTDSQIPPEHAEPVVWPKVSNMNPGSAAPHAASQKPPEHVEPVIWPKVSNKVVEENTSPEFPKQSFAWPKVQRCESDLNTESGKPSATSKTPFVLPGEKTQKKSDGVILFQTIAILAEAEKVLDNEGCTITRITSPVDPPSGSNIALRFPWSQYETVKSSLDKAGVKTQGIKQL